MLRIDEDIAGTSGHKRRLSKKEDKKKRNYNNYRHFQRSQTHDVSLSHQSWPCEIIPAGPGLARDAAVQIPIGPSDGIDPFSFSSPLFCSCCVWPVVHTPRHRNRPSELLSSHQIIEFNLCIGGTEPFECGTRRLLLRPVAFVGGPVRQR